MLRFPRVPLRALFFSAVAAAAPTPCERPRAAAPPGTWQVSFFDDFAFLNTSSWTVADHDSIKSEYDGHDALFVADAVSIRNGTLVITTTYAPNTVFNQVVYNMTSGWL